MTTRSNDLGLMFPDSGVSVTVKPFEVLAVTEVRQGWLGVTWTE